MSESVNENLDKSTNECLMKMRYDLALKFVNDILIFLKKDVVKELKDVPELEKLSFDDMVMMNLVDVNMVLLKKVYTTKELKYNGRHRIKTYVYNLFKTLMELNGVCISTKQKEQRVGVNLTKKIRICYVEH